MNAREVRAAEPPRRRLRPHPAQIIFGGFGTVVLIGTGLLSLPIAKAGPGGATFIEALFTSASALFVTGHIRARLTTAAEAHSLGLDDIRSLVLSVVRISAAIELVVATVLAVRFATGYGYSPLEAIWLGIFHGVSSFNNAGFSLFSDSIVGFASDPVISLVICVSVILGGLGFPVLLQLLKYGRLPRLWNMNTRLVITGPTDKAEAFSQVR
jgi:Trk-type K+ transport system membrane component